MSPFGLWARPLWTAAGTLANLCLRLSLIILLDYLLNKLMNAFLVYLGHQGNLPFCWWCHKAGFVSLQVKKCIQMANQMLRCYVLCTTHSFSSHQAAIQPIAHPMPPHPTPSKRISPTQKPVFASHPGQFIDSTCTIFSVLAYMSLLTAQWVIRRMDNLAYLHSSMCQILERARCSQLQQSHKLASLLEGGEKKKQAVFLLLAKLTFLAQQLILLFWMFI